MSSAPRRSTIPDLNRGIPAWPTFPATCITRLSTSTSAIEAKGSSRWGSDYAQGELGDIVYLELPKVGSSFARHDVFGTIEAVKAVSELFAPVAGEVTEVNGRLDAEPALVNTDPFGDGWMVRLKLSDPLDMGTLMKADAYSAQIG